MYIVEPSYNNILAITMNRQGTVKFSMCSTIKYPFTTMFRSHINSCNNYNRLL